MRKHETALGLILLHLVTVPGPDDLRAQDGQ
jgi:hypothetical protein